MFGKGKKLPAPRLDRKQVLASIPVLNPLVTMERDERGNTVLNVPRKRSGIVQLTARVFRLPLYKKIELDELGAYAMALCDGSNTFAEVIARFAEKFRLNRREAEVSMTSYLQTLAKRGIIVFGIPKEASNGS